LYQGESVALVGGTGWYKVIRRTGEKRVIMLGKRGGAEIENWGRKEGGAERIGKRTGTVRY